MYLALGHAKGMRLGMGVHTSAAGPPSNTGSEKQAKEITGNFGALDLQTWSTPYALVLTAKSSLCRSITRNIFHRSPTSI
jgi:hypothetical protein